MNYFKVKPESHDLPMGNSWKLVANELITEKEAARRKWSLDLLKKHTEVIDINPRRTYFFFGARSYSGNNIVGSSKTPMI